MEEFYYYDGREVIGPHSLPELQEMYAMAVISNQTPVLRQGDKDWYTLGQFCDLNAPECQPLDLDESYYNPYATALEQFAAPQSSVLEALPDAPSDQTHTSTIIATEEHRESLREEDEELRQQRTTQHQLLRHIRLELDALWEAQRESIIARIRFEQLDKKYESTRKRSRDIFRIVEENAIEYWRRSGLLTACIRELTWKEHDFSVRLRGKNESEKYQYLQRWLEDSRIADLSGCYCFKNGKEYIYIGQAGVLRDRLKQHEKKTYFTYATSARIVIPKYARRLNQLERLLILAHQPTENGNNGMAGKTPIDECLDFIRGEIKELVTDF